MTSGEIGTICGAIVAGFGVLGGAIRWSAGVLKAIAGRLIKSLDESTDAQRETAKAMGTFTAAVARFEVKVDEARAASVETRSVVEEIADEVSGVHDGPPRPRTPPGGVPTTGYYSHRPGTKGDR